MILAPVIVDRKGEHVELFIELRAKGFVRLRIDGKVYEIDDTPKLAKTTKHSVEVVVDRLKVNPEFKQRLAESYETALREGDGRAITVELGEDKSSGKEHLFSAKFACPVCNYALQELEPRLFSFNNPMGACPECDGLGAIEFFDPRRVVAHPHLSLASGAIKGWDRRNQFYFQMLTSLAAHYQFDLDKPFEKLPEGSPGHPYGSGADKIAFQYINERGRATVREHTFEGIIPNLERRYRETDSVMVREELAKYLNNKPCPECAGTRLRREARHVKVGLPQNQNVSHPAAEGGAIAFFALVLTGQRRNRRQDRQGNRQPAAVPDRRRPRLPVARPLGRDAVGRRVAAHPARVADRLGADRRDVRARRAVDRPAPARQQPAARRRTCATWATACWSSSTTRKRSTPPTG
jgi:excinuclease ABC subunit A